MNIKIGLDGISYDVLMPGYDISIPLVFNGDQPNTYGVEKAKSGAYKSGGWVGDVREGGSCNFETLTMTPHCNGTHTECIGHITRSRIYLRDQLKETLFPCMVVSVEPLPASGCGESYLPGLNPEDKVITRHALASAMPSVSESFRQALVVRTRPNPTSKKNRDYMQEAPAFFTLDAMKFLVEFGVNHLLTDLPSVDRLFDEGLLSTHHVFWGLPHQGHDPVEGSRVDATITEMVFVPDHVEDGPYLLNLQTAPFMADAAPSRPFLFPLKNIPS